MTPAPVVLGGRRTRWTWLDENGQLTPRPVAGQLPGGLVVDHGDHTLLVPWVPVNGLPAFTLDSLMPLTIVEFVDCVICGTKGRIVEGTWLPSEVSK